MRQRVNRHGNDYWRRFVRHIYLVWEDFDEIGVAQTRVRVRHCQLNLITCIASIVVSGGRNIERTTRANVVVKDGVKVRVMAKPHRPFERRGIGIGRTAKVDDVAGLEQRSIGRLGDCHCREFAHLDCNGSSRRDLSSVRRAEGSGIDTLSGVCVRNRRIAQPVDYCAVTEVPGVGERSGATVSAPGKADIEGCGTTCRRSRGHNGEAIVDNTVNRPKNPYVVEGTVWPLF